MIGSRSARARSPGAPTRATSSGTPRSSCCPSSRSRSPTRRARCSCTASTRLPAARRRAAAMGYRGALYAWESADTGDDVTPAWVVMPNGERASVAAKSEEHHISADVAYGVWSYWRATADDAFMIRRGRRDPGRDRALLGEPRRSWGGRALPRARRGRPRRVPRVRGRRRVHERHGAVEPGAGRGAGAPRGRALARRLARARRAPRRRGGRAPTLGAGGRAHVHGPGSEHRGLRAVPRLFRPRANRSRRVRASHGADGCAPRACGASGDRR